MGGRCDYCGCTDLDQLEFNHKHERTWDSREVSSARRLLLYSIEYSFKKINLACGLCNKRLGKPGEPDPDFYVPPEEDF
jgi:hypothetical protein